MDISEDPQNAGEETQPSDATGETSEVPMENEGGNLASQMACTKKRGNGSGECNLSQRAGMKHAADLEGDDAFPCGLSCA